MDHYVITFMYAIFSFMLVYIVFEMTNNIVEHNFGCNCKMKEGFDFNSPEYSHTVDLPINNPVSCQNFCGPTGKCVKTGSQCLADIDCFGCKPRKNPYPNSVYNMNALSSEASGKLSGALGLNYSPLTTGSNNAFEEAYPGSHNTEVGKPYRGVDKWEKAFNEGILLYNKRQETNPELSEFEKNIRPAYPVQLSVTGLFYETTPLPGNVPTNL